MKKYFVILFGTALVAIALTFAVALSLIPAPIKAEYWLRGMILAKREIVQKYRGKPKILVLAGSSALFGIDAREMSRILGVPVLNLGLHAGLPLATLLQEGRFAAEPGDVLILPLEDVYYHSAAMTSWQARSMIAWDRERWDALSLLDRIHGIYLLGPNIIRELYDARRQERRASADVSLRLQALDDERSIEKFHEAARSTEFVYSHLNIDDHGDMSHTDGSRFRDAPQYPLQEVLFDAAVRKELLSFVKEIKSRGVEVYFTYQPYMERNGIDLKAVDKASVEFAQKMVPLGNMLEGRSELIFPASYFFDTELHLNAKGRDVRTQKLIAAMLKNSRLLTWLREHQAH